MDTLNPPQLEAATHQHGALLVLAGAGSGKTRVITQKIAWLINERDVPASAVLALTFTNKAAREMRSRVNALMPNKAVSRGLIVSTFHSLGMKLLQQEHEAAGLREQFSIIDGKDATGIISDLLKSDLSPDSDILDAVQQQISTWKNAGISPGAVMPESTNPVIKAAVKAYPEYDRYLRACNVVDLDDLILLPKRLLEENEAVLTRWRAKVRYILVDEYQDTNGVQYDFIKKLAGEGRGLTVVGDDDQSIYGWRGALPENLVQLKADFPDIKVVKLEQNYRSVGRILKVANELISNNPRPFDKKLWSDKQHGETIRVIGAKDEDNEANRVVSMILKHQFQYKSDYSEFAILYRSNFQARVFEKKLREVRIPYKVSGGLSFFDRSEIRDMLAYLRLLTNQDDDRAFIRVINTPRRGIGASSLEKLGQFAAARKISLFEAMFENELNGVLRQATVDTLTHFGQKITELSFNAERGDSVEVFKELLDHIEYENWLKDSEDLEVAERRWKNVQEFIGWITTMNENAEQGASLTDILSQLVLRDILEKSDDETERNELNLMTFHAAKGLEFNHVYMVGVEEDLLPHKSSVDDGTVEEERRLMYVGITRAMRTLTMSYAAKRKRYGDVTMTDPSRFLEELPESELEWERDASEVNPEEQKEVGRASIANIRAMLGTDE